MEKDDEIKGGGNSYDFGARLYDSRLGRWMSIDPLASQYVPFSPYHFAANNPIKFIDNDGKVIMDGQHEVVVSYDEKGSVQFKRSDGSNVSSHFMEKAAPILKSMSASEMGRNDIETLHKLPTKVYISHSKGSSNTGNSFVKYGKKGKDGFYETAHISPNLGNYDPKSGSEYNEWLGATMTVETGHIDSKEQIGIEEAGYSNDPADPEFARVYKGLLNRAVKFRIQYRDEKNLQLNDVTFAPIEDNNKTGLLKYDKDNQSRKNQYEQQKNTKNATKETK